MMLVLIFVLINPIMVQANIDIDSPIPSSFSSRNNPLFDGVVNPVKIPLKYIFIKYRKYKRIDY